MIIIKDDLIGNSWGGGLEHFCPIIKVFRFTYQNGDYERPGVILRKRGCGNVT